MATRSAVASIKSISRLIRSGVACMCPTRNSGSILLPILLRLGRSNYRFVTLAHQMVEQGRLVVRQVSQFVKLVPEVRRVAQLLHTLWWLLPLIAKTRALTQQWMWRQETSMWPMNSTLGAISLLLAATPYQRKMW